MNVGLFFGSFNPIHTGHLIIANTVLNELPLSEIWFIVSPQNPLKKKTDLLNAENRIQLVKKGIEGDTRLLVSDVEFKLPKPSYTIDTLEYLEKEYKDKFFYLIIGSDSFLQLKKWKKHEAIIKKNIVVYERPGYILPTVLQQPNIIILKSPLLNISATQIRALIKRKKSIRYLVPEKIIQLIDNHCFYK